MVCLAVQLINSSPNLSEELHFLTRTAWLLRAQDTGVFSWLMGEDLVLLPDSQAEDGVVFQVMDLQEGRQAGREKQIM